MTSVFPLRLTPFERYIHLDHRPSHPMVWVVELEFQGKLEEGPTRTAVAAALDRQPLLRTTVGRGSIWKLPRPAGDLPLVEWGEGGAAPHTIDLSREVGFRCRVIPEGDRTRMVVEFHHATVDGVGAVQPLLDFLEAYPQAVLRVEPVFSTPTPLSELLPQRERTLRAPSNVVASETSVPPPGPGEILSFLRRRIAVLRGESSGVDAAPPVPGIIGRTLSAELSRDLRNVSAHFGASINDVLLCTLFRTLADWNAQEGKVDERKWLRILVPNDLREPSDARVPAANILGYAFIDRTRAQCSDPGTLIAGVRDEMRAVRTRKLGALFLEGLTLSARIPGLLWLITRSRKPFATAVFSNLGSPLSRSRHVNDLASGKDGAPRLERMLGATPLRPGTRASFVLVRLHGRTTISLRTDPNHFDRAATIRLLELFFGHLEEVVHLYSRG